MNPSFKHTHYSPSITNLPFSSRLLKFPRGKTLSNERDYLSIVKAQHMLKSDTLEVIYQALPASVTVVTSQKAGADEARMYVAVDIEMLLNCLLYSICYYTVTRYNHNHILYDTLWVVKKVI